MSPKLTRSPKPVKSPLMKRTPLTRKEDMEENGGTSSESDHHKAPSSLSSTLKKLLLQAKLDTKRKMLQMELEEKELANKKEILKLEHQINLEEIYEQEGVDGDDLDLEDDFLSAFNQMKVDENVQRWAQNRSPSPKPTAPPESRPVSPQPTTPVDPIRVGLTGSSTEEKLTKILARQSVSKDLPVFDGNPLDWPFFLSRYTETTELFGFSDTDNMSRLIKCLKGEAKEVATGLLLSSKNVALVMEQLKMNFGQPQQIIWGLINKVQKVSDVREEKPETILALNNAVTTLVANVTALDHEEYFQNPQLMVELEQKLHGSLRTMWTMKKLEKDKMDLRDFNQFMSKLASAFCQARTFKSIEKPEKKVGEEKKKFHVNAVEVPQKAEQNSMAKSECLFCERKGHNLDICRKFMKEDSDKKWKFVKGLNLCFRCLKGEHLGRNCPLKDKTCGVEGCHANHHPILHYVRPQGERANPTENVHSSNDGASSQPLLRVIPVVLSGPNGTVKSHALLDEGSTVTMIQADLAKQLGIQGTLEPLRVQWFDQTPKEEKQSERINLKIQGDFPGANSFLMKNVRTVEEFKLKPYSLDVKQLKSRWAHLKRLNMISMHKVNPMILIGIDNAKLTAHHEILESNDGPMGTRTKLGWAVGGGGESCSSVTMCHVQGMNDDRTTHVMMEEFFSTEQFGVRVTENASRSKEDLKALRILEETSKRTNESQWEVGLLWKSDSTSMPPSKENALARLKMQERKMDRNPDFAHEYCRKISEYQEKGYIRKLTSDEANVSTPKTWILPHFGVLNPNKPGKLRLVYDAAAKSQGISLNSALLTGPDFQNNLQAVLWRFRERPIGFTADITDMFHRILIRDEDLCAQRFLWRGMNRTRDPDMYQMNVMIFGATSSPSTAIYIKNKTALENQMDFPEAAQEIMDNFYMDDYLGCSWDEEDANRLIPEVIGINAKADFKLCKFLSNSPSVLERIPEDLRASGVKSLDEKTELPIERVLGLWWNADIDTFTFKVNYYKVPEQILNCEKIPTKREMARLVMSMYDPLGFIAPFKIKGLILLQSAWKEKVDWDEQIPAPLNDQWREWVQEIRKVTEVRIPRCYAPGLNRSQNQLHVFVDASEEAFDAAAYIRAERNGNVEVSLVAAKVRVAPLKPLTIPRLELQAAVIGSRLAESIRKESRIEFENLVIWSDSKTVLGWIRSTSGRFDRFVSNRVGEILQTTMVEQWRWIPSALNVADDATRKCKPCDFNPQGRWFTGPEFLKECEDQWPVENDKSSMEPENEELCAAVILDDPTDIPVPKADSFSSFTRIVRATAAVITAAKIWNNKLSHGTSREKMNFYSVDTTQQAERMLWRKVQLDSFGEEYLCLQKDKQPPKNSRIMRLNPFLDENNLIRMRGRIQDIPGVPMKSYNPVILDPKHPITKLIINQAHLEGAHCGQERVVCSLREKFWILDIRTAVRSAWNRCQDCRNRRANPVPPQMGNLPPCRLQMNKPAFSSTGVDYFGPMTVTIGRRHEKRWGVLFTCMTTRAIHLELSPSLETDQMLMTLMRFINRRGKPENMHSDNGTNFVGANEELKRCLDNLNNPVLHSKLAIHGIKWHFIPPAAPHMGGSWERLVQTVKKTLNRLLKEQNPKEYTLLTLLTEVENIVNGRPLTHSSNDPEDPECLTPNHFLRPSTFMGPSLAAEFEDADLLLRKQWRYAQRMADHFWSRWVKEYLPTIQKREKWNENALPIRIGDVVILVDDLLPRNSWKKGIITDVFPGLDGVTRVVEVKTTHGIYKRPVTKICPLRLRIGDDGDPSSGRRNVAGASVV